MIPIKDDNPTYTFPIITILLILANIGIFIYQFSLGSGAQAFVYRLGAVPWEITHFREVPRYPVEYRSAIPGVLTLFTSMFLHGGIIHLLGNMLYLYIFGDNIEALMGHGKFFVFYVGCGLIATLAHVVPNPNSTIPMVGASGAISGVLGAYLLRYPRAKVHVLIIFLLFIRVVRVSALFVLGFWFLMQVFNGFVQSGGGVAWFAHIGGFIAGMVLVFFFEKKDRVQQNRRSSWWW